MTPADRRAALVDRVIAAMLEAAAQRGDRVRLAHEDEADAAIDLVLEEAAQLALDAMPFTQDAEGEHYAAFCEKIAAAIRALKNT